MTEKRYIDDDAVDWTLEEIPVNSDLDALTRDLARDLVAANARVADLALQLEQSDAQIAEDIHRARERSRQAEERCDRVVRELEAQNKHLTDSRDGESHA